MVSPTKAPNFEHLIGELETLVAALETGDLSLEDSLSTFEKGITLTQQCQQQLSEAKQKVSMLIGEGDDIHLVDFEGSDA